MSHIKQEEQPDSLQDVANRLNKLIDNTFSPPSEVGPDLLELERRQEMLENEALRKAFPDPDWF